MVKIDLQIKATLENISELYTNHPDYAFILKLKCLGCGEISEKWHPIIESETVPTKTGKTETNFLAKCKFCLRENSLDIVKGSNGKFSSEIGNKFQSIVHFDCRGLEPVEFKPAEGWIATAEKSSKVFSNIDLSDDWVEYDDKVNEPVGIYEITSQFVKIK